MRIFNGLSRSILSLLVLVSIVASGCGRKYEVEIKQGGNREMKIYRYQGSVSRTEVYQLVEDNKKRLEFIIFWESDGRINMISLKSRIPKGRHVIQFYKKHEKIALDGGRIAWRNELDIESSYIPEYWKSVEGHREFIYTVDNDFIFAGGVFDGGRVSPVAAFFENFAATREPSPEKAKLTDEILQNQPKDA